ncbi:hypothetical protein pipiens_016506 [Culex pipiens pipiens]|uniref:Uncharacterized protein n=1 Tax=Culex pipiens pipiens TaxID=38569 RepID=A0ABD1CL00_CULPP
MGETSGLLAGGSEGGGGCDTSGGSRSGLNSAERKGFGRWRDRRYFGPRLWFREDACEKKCALKVTNWWGVLPFGQRKRLWDKYNATTKKPFRPIVNTLEVTAGAQICMKNSPMYQHGAIGLTISNGVPKFGQLLNAAWDHTIICRFKLLPMSTLSYNKIASGGASNSSSTGTEGLLSSSEVKEKVCSSSLGSGSGSTKKASGVRRQQRNARFEHLSDTGSAGNSHKRMAPKKDEE